MKVDPTQHTPPSIEPSKSPERTRKTDPSFQNVLKEKLGGSEAQRGEVSSTPPVASPLMVSPLPPVEDINASETEALRRVEALIDELERYQTELLDPRHTLRSMAPTIRSLERHVAKVEALLQQAGVPRELKAILQEAAARAQVEIFKFNGGALL